MDALDYLISQNLFFELNTRMIRNGRIYPHKRFLKRIRERGGEIVISSDAHHSTELNQGFAEAVQLAKECEFEYTNYLTMNGGQLNYVRTKL